MPTIKQLPVATSVDATDLLPVSQSGTTKGLTIGGLLSSTQPALSLAAGKLLGRVSSTAGGPEPVSLGSGLTVSGGVLSATGADHASFPASSALSAGDEVILNGGSGPKRLAATALRDLFSAGTGISLSGGTISATAGSSYALPAASTTVLGGVKVDGSSVVVDGSGRISAPGKRGVAARGAPNGVDDTAAFQALADALMAAGGGEFYIPAGRYVISAPIVFRLTSETYPAPRVRIVGEGPMSSHIRSTHAGAAIDFEGGTGLNSHLAFLAVEGISLDGPGSAVGSIGLQLTSCAYMRVSDVLLTSYEYGINALDFEQSDIDNTVITYCTKGMRASVGVLTGVNSIALRNCNIAFCSQYGIWATTGTGFLLDNATIQYCGPASQSPLSWGIRLDDFGSTNSVGLNAVNAYFEGNGGCADIWINNTRSPAAQSANTLMGTEFLRLSNTKYVTNNILVTGTISTLVSLLGCGFIGITPPYAPDLGRPYWSVTNTASGSRVIEVADSNTFTHVAERPAQVGGYAPLLSPALSGVPTAPTASGGTNTTQLATTAFVQSTVASLVGGAPAALDTLKELADAINDDSNFAATVTTALAGKVAKTANLSDLSNVAVARSNLGLAAVASSGAYSDISGAPAAYSLPAATPGSRGGVRPDGTTLTISGDVLSVAAVYAPLASPGFTGNPTAPTQVAGNNSTRLATTAYADAGDATRLLASANLSDIASTAVARANLNRGAVALTAGAAIATDCSQSSAFTLTLGVNATLTNPSNLAAGASYLWKITQDATGGRTLAFGSSFRWPGGSTPVLSTGGGAVDILSGVSDGTYVYGVLTKAFA